MADDKAQAFFILNEDDVIEQKVAQVLGKLFHSANPSSHHNAEELGRKLGASFSLQNQVANAMRFQIEDMVKSEICNHLRMDSYLDPHHENLHIRLSYKGNGVTQQTINLRRY
jgi:hypothetical protein